MDGFCVLSGSLALLGPFGVFAQPGLAGTQQHVRAVWITGGGSPASPSAPSNSLSRAFSPTAPVSHPAVETTSAIGTVRLVGNLVFALTVSRNKE